MSDLNQLDVALSLPTREEFLANGMRTVAPLIGDDSCCPICKDEWVVEGDKKVSEVVDLDCPAAVHVFHKSCIVSWVGEESVGGSTQCPLCRRGLFEVEVIDDAYTMVDDGDGSDESDVGNGSDGESEHSDGELHTLTYPRVVNPLNQGPYEFGSAEFYSHVDRLLRLHYPWITWIDDDVAGSDDDRLLARWVRQRFCRFVLRAKPALSQIYGVDVWDEVLRFYLLSSMLFHNMGSLRPENLEWMLDERRRDAEQVINHMSETQNHFLIGARRLYPLRIEAVSTGNAMPTSLHWELFPASGTGPSLLSGRQMVADMNRVHAHVRDPFNGLSYDIGVGTDFRSRITVSLGEPTGPDRPTIGMYGRNDGLISRVDQSEQDEGVKVVYELTCDRLLAIELRWGTPYHYTGYRAPVDW